MTVLGKLTLSVLRPAFAALVLALCSTASALEVGEMAPDFELPASDGNTYRLSDYRGKQAVILAWFPRAFTSGCTIECKSLTKNGPELRRFDATYFMASVDPLDENTRFAESNGADFPLLSDANKEVATAYGVLYQDRFALRHTIYIDTEGVVVAIDSNVNPRTSAEDMITMLKELAVPMR
ncbi:MAG: peroxiredoxin [Pseudomonadota bacterium]